MQKERKISLGILAIAIVLISIVAIMPQEVPNIGKEVTARIVWKDSNGNIKGDYFTTVLYKTTTLNHNIVTNNGLNETIDQLIAPENDDICKYIEFSTETTPTASMSQVPATQITGNGLDRVAGSITLMGVGHVHIYKLFTLSGTQSGIASVWLCYESSNTNPDTFCGIAISPVINAIATDTIEVTISIEVTNT